MIVVFSLPSTQITSNHPQDSAIPGAILTGTPCQYADFTVFAIHLLLPDHTPLHHCAAFIRDFAIVRGSLSRHSSSSSHPAVAYWYGCRGQFGLGGC